MNTECVSALCFIYIVAMFMFVWVICLRVTVKDVQGADLLRESGPYTVYIRTCMRAVKLAYVKYVSHQCTFEFASVTAKGSTGQRCTESNVCARAL